METPFKKNIHTNLLYTKKSNNESIY